MINLTPDQQEQLVKLLAGAVDLGQLEQFVYLGTGDRLFVEFVGPGLPLKPTLRKLIEALELGPITDRFLRVVYREKPFQSELRKLIAQLYPEIPAAAERTPAVVEFQVAGKQAGQPAEGPGLQRIVKPKLRLINTQIWLSRFESIKRQVCRIEFDGKPYGTGFLVGPQAVLTNWHVARDAVAAGAADKLLCRFDYQRRADGGVDPGVTLAVAAVVDQRPCSDAELTEDPDTPPPKAGDLDFALLRLAAPEAERGYVKLAEGPPADAGAPLIIVQHPNGEPMQFAIDSDSVIGFVHDKLRLRYKTNTLPGSSGSPCFSMDWDLLALHHLGDPAAGPSPYNQGVPVGLIRAQIAAGAGADLLGA